MKKMIMLLLAAVMCISFASCGDMQKKSEAVENVEKMIADLPELPMENYDEIDIAREKIDAVEVAYNALSAEEQDKVENWQTFETERTRLFENEYKWAALSIQYMNLNTEHVISGNVTIWDNVGASDFLTYQEDVIIAGEIGYDGMISRYGSDDALYVFWVAGYAVDKEYFGENFFSFSSSKITETEEKCKSYVQSIKNIEDSHESIKAFIDVMVKDYSKEYSTEMDALQNWWIESSLYADHALDPSGNLNSYISDANEYKDNIQRYQKIAGY
ncbi:MAG: hypothetical protein E7437_00880 [Ruminococcaceae bacterium]|nr:hypothetical protein [Oscillospiraceae bacterium]